MTLIELFEVGVGALCLAQLQSLLLVLLLKLSVFGTKVLQLCLKLCQAICILLQLGALCDKFIVLFFADDDALA